MESDVPSPVTCPNLTDLAHGMVQSTGSHEGDTAIHTCNVGFELVGAPVLICQSDGTWDNPPPVCQSSAGRK